MGRSTAGAVRCRACGESFSLARVPELGSTPHERYQRALQHSQENQIDLASAYSVLLGNMSLEVALAIGRARGPGSMKRATADSGPASESPLDLEEANYDPGFRAAVSQGYLTVWEAAQRGDRVIYASSLARRHDLPMRLAFTVADNKLSLRKAVAQSLSEKPEPVKPASVAARRHTGLTFGIAAVVLAVVGLLGWGLSPHIVENGQQPTVKHKNGLSSAEVRTDDTGRVLEVVGPDPRLVLIVFCEASPRPNLYEPVRIVIPPRRAGIRLGILRDVADPEPLYAIEIQRQDGRWVAGNGREPVAVAVAPAISPGNSPISVDRS